MLFKKSKSKQESSIIPKQKRHLFRKDKEKRNIEEKKSIFKRKVNNKKSQPDIVNVEAVDSNVKQSPSLLEMTKEIEKKEKTRFRYVIALIILASLVYGTARYVVKDIKFKSSVETIFVGDSINLDYAVIPSSANVDELYFEFSDPEKVIIDDEGRYIAKDEGSITINVYHKDKVYDTKTVEIQPVLVQSITADNLELGIGRSIELKVSIEPSNATHTEYEAVSLNENIVTFKDGIITAISEGDANLSIKSIDGPSKTIKVTSFAVEPDSIDLQLTESNYVTGSVLESTIVYNPIDVTNKVVSYYSSNENIAKFDNDGNLEILDAGTVTLKAVYSDEIYAEKTITAKYPEVKTIAISDKTTSISVGETHKVKIDIEPAKYDGELTWYSDNEQVAKVDSNGNVKAISTGSVRISVKSSNGVKTSIKYDVKAPVVSVTPSLGSSSSSSSSINKNVNESTNSYCLNTSTHKFHKSSCGDISKMKESNKSWVNSTREDIINSGYSPCGHCHP